MPRAYDNTRRARAAARTTQAIAQATESLLRTGSLNDVTLQAIAADAGVTVQTVLRHMGSRDGCLEAVRDRVRARVLAQRDAAPSGDVDGALSVLMAHYEAEGQLILHLLAQESGGHALAAEAAEEGRAYHRAWVQRCLGSPEDPAAVDALVAATDLYVWKLLRLDLGRSVPSTQATLARLVRGVLESS